MKTVFCGMCCEEVNLDKGNICPLCGENARGSLQNLSDDLEDLEDPEISDNTDEQILENNTNF